jgi:hypothetical protein
MDNVKSIQEEHQEKVYKRSFGEPCYGPTGS